MSDDLKDSNGEPDMTANGDVSEKANQKNSDVDVNKQKNDSVAYETYKKALGLAKKREAELEVERAEKQKLLEEKLQTEGKKDELIESLKKKYSESEDKLKKVVGSFANRSLKNAISLEASKEGCIDTEALLKLTELSAEMIDDEFNANQDMIKDLVESSKKNYSFLFPKSAPAAKTGTPKAGQASSPDDWKKLPLKEQAMMAFSGLKKQ